MKPQADFGRVIAAIEARGFEVRVYHERRLVSEDGKVLAVGTWKELSLELPKMTLELNVWARIDPQWGATTVKITDPATKQCWLGHASTKLPDQFNRKRGLAITMGRALKDAHIDVNKLGTPSAEQTDNSKPVNKQTVDSQDRLNTRNNEN